MRARDEWWPWVVIRINNFWTCCLVFITDCGSTRPRPRRNEYHHGDGYMIYAEISNGQIAQYIYTAGPMPAHKLRPDLLQVVDVDPVLDPETQMVTGYNVVVLADRVERQPVIGTRPPPETITKMQFVRACVRAGRMTHADALAYVSQGTLPPIIQRAIAAIPAGERADLTLKNVGSVTLDRTDLVFQRLVALGDATDDQIDKLFRLAASLK
jgi:hypothetical protein